MVIKTLTNLIDRCLFTCVFILGVQLPEFIQQYSQRLSGHLNEALMQLNEFQLIANRHFEGNLSNMIDKYLINSEPSIKETANIIVNTSNRVSDLQTHLFNLEEAEYIKRLYYFINDYNASMAQATFQQFQLAIPLNLSALLTGAIFALFVVIISHMLLGLAKRLITLIKQKLSTKINMIDDEFVE